MADLYHRLDGYDDLDALLAGSDEDALVALRGKPALIRIPGTDEQPRGRLLTSLLHGNEDSGFRACLDALREGRRYPFDLWVFLGNVRAAMQEGWWAHRYLDDQEDFNRVWGLQDPTTRMRRCADAVLDEVVAADLEAAVDLHNNTGDSDPYAIVPVRTEESVRLAAVCADTTLLWGLRAHTLMQALSPHCAAIAVECGRSGLPASAEWARAVVRRVLDADLDGEPGAKRSARIFELRHQVVVRPEVPFAFGGLLTEELDLVLTPGLDAMNFGMLLAGSAVGHVHPGAAVPLRATSMRGDDETARFFAVTGDGRLVITQDATPIMMTTTVLQARRDCLTYLGRRRA